jgi:transcriptional regulator with XRE-family HTH domain
LPELANLPAGWDYGPEQRPARSLLAGLEPIGLGTPMAESLAGYIARLSWRRGLAPARLVRDVLAPALGHPAMPDADASAWEEELARVTRHPAASLLGHAPVAATWADALGAATGRPVLRALTLLPWADVLPKKGLLRAKRAWCPMCLETRRLQGLVAYEPLLWQFAELTACVEHRLPLSTACPACGAGAGILTAWARVGYCRCGAWLGSMGTIDGSRVGGDDLDWQRYVTEQVGALIAATPGLPGQVSGRRTADVVTLAWERTGLSLTRLAAATGLALSTLSLWKDGRRQPSLPGALRLCRIAGIALVDFLRGDIDAISTTPPAELGLPYVRPSDERHVAHDWSVILARLESEMAAEPPRSLASILRELDLDIRQAKHECAAECAAIAERHGLWEEERVKMRREEKAAMVRAAIAGLLAEGQYPSRYQVQKRLPSPVSLRDPALNAIWTEEAREPGRTFLKV